MLSQPALSGPDSWTVASKVHVVRALCNSWRSVCARSSPQLGWDANQVSGWAADPGPLFPLPDGCLIIGDAHADVQQSGFRATVSRIYAKEGVKGFYRFYAYDMVFR